MSPGRAAAAVALDRSTVLPTYARANLTIVRGEGCRVWDDAGNAYLDFGGGIAVTGLGHRHPVRIRRRIHPVAVITLRDRSRSVPPSF